MNPEKNVVILYDKNLCCYADKSNEIMSIRKDGHIIFVRFNNGKEYPYSNQNIRWITNPSVFETNNMLCFNGNNQISDFKLVLKFEEYYKFFFNNGEIKTYKSNDLKFVKSVQNIKSVKNVLNYFQEVLGVIEGTEDNQILSKQLNSMKVREDSFLSDFLQLNPIRESKTKISTFIYPFGSNNAQRKAVENAFNYNISLIQGPPGTGKTQTILNIIANALVNKKNIAVVSGNNEAIKNVDTKLKKCGIDFLTAFLGNKDNIEKFFNEISNKDKKALEFNLKCEKVDLKRLYDISKRIETTQQYEIDISKLNKLLTELIIEKNCHDKECLNLEQLKLNKLSKLKMNSDSLLSLAAELECLSEKQIRKLSTKFHFLQKYKIFNIKKIFTDIDGAITLLHNKYYNLKIEEIKQEIEQKEKYLQVNNFKNLVNTQKILSENYLYYYLKNNLLNNSYFGEFNERTYRFNFAKFTERFPIVFSTTHSLRTCSGNDFLYDYLIIDEASQVDLISACVAYSCAKNVILVGDCMQLQHVVKSNNLNALKYIFDKFSLPKNFEYSVNSILKATSSMYCGNIKSTLLNEHYRCDPQIIEFCNKRFYNDELIIRTKRGEGNAIKIITNEPYHEKGRTNPRQIEIINKYLSENKNEDIGIIAPYRDQVNLLAQKFGDSIKAIDTVHKFQGKENNVIILSTVANKVKIYENEEKFDFLNYPNLLNVAISRAKEKLIVIASNDLLKQENTILSDLYRYVSYYCPKDGVEKTDIFSVFDIMFDEYNEKLEEFKAKLHIVSKFMSENIIATLLLDIFKQSKFSMLSFKHNYPLRYMIRTDLIKNEDDRRFAMNRNTHCDFVIFNKLDKSIKLIVEVDGRQHEDKIQAIRDERKDRLLKNAGYNFIRIKTTDVNCEQIIVDALNIGVK